MVRNGILGLAVVAAPQFAGPALARSCRQSAGARHVPGTGILPPLRPAAPGAGAGRIGIRRFAICLGIVLGSAAPAAAAETFRCPASLDGRRLSEFNLFDGPPEQLASLVPARRGRWYGWELTAPAQAGAGYYLRCRYGGAGRALDFRPDRSARVCTDRSRAGRNEPVVVVCE